MKKLLSYGCVALLVLLALVLAGCSDKAPEVTVWPTTSPEEKAEADAQLSGLAEFSNRQLACADMLEDAATVNTIAFNSVVDLLNDDLAKGEAKTVIFVTVKDFFEAHGDACGHDASQAMTALFGVHYDLLDNPSADKLEYAAQLIEFYTEQLVDTASDYTGVEVPR